MCVCVCVSIHRAVLWILGEYCTSVEDISNVLAQIKASLGEVNLMNDDWGCGSQKRDRCGSY